MQLDGKMSMLEQPESQRCSGPVDMAAIGAERAVVKANVLTAAPELQRIWTKLCAKIRGDFSLDLLGRSPPLGVAHGGNEDPFG